MFTGLIREIGTIRSIRSIASGFEFWIEAPDTAADANLGDSIAVNGICLTVSAVRDASFRAEAVGPTVAKTNASTWKTRQSVHIEPALTLSDRLGGHLVQGHVQTTVRVESVRGTGRNKLLRFSLPSGIRVENEASVALDGASLTVSAVALRWFEVSIVPHTLEKTLFGSYRVGQAVNFESDSALRTASELTYEKLASWGWSV